MTPANDAFTLNNRYSYSHSRRSPRPTTRSPSPTSMSVGIGKLARRNSSMTVRRLSHGGSNGSALHDIGEDATRKSEARCHHENDRRTRRKDLERVDWEIPRKSLHSSIGTDPYYVFSCFLHSATYRFSRHTPLHARVFGPPCYHRALWSLGDHFSRRRVAAS